MRIETKFTPGQKVWAIYKNKVQEFMVETVEATCSYSYDLYTPNRCSTKYKLRVGESDECMVESSEFQLERDYALSKEELLKKI